MRAGVAVVLAAVALAACTGQGDATPLSAGGGSARPTGPSATPSGSGAAAPAPGSSVLTSGVVRLTVRPQDAAQRQVLQAYLGFFAAYADALGRGDAASAELRRRTTPAAFADFSRGIAGNAKDGLTLRGPVTLRPALQAGGSGALTVVLVDCLDASRQRFHDRSGKPTGDVGRRRPVQVQLVDTPSTVRYVVSALSAGPASACERSGS